MKTFEEELEFYYSYLLKMKDIVSDINISIKTKTPEKLAEVCRLPGYRQAISALFGGSKYEELMLRYTGDSAWQWDPEEIMGVSRSRKLIIDAAMGEVRPIPAVHLLYAVNGDLDVTLRSKGIILKKGQVMAVGISVPHGVRPHSGGAFPVSLTFQKSYREDMDFWEHGESLFNQFFSRCFSINNRPRDFVLFDTAEDIWLRYWMLKVYHEFYHAGILSKKAILTYMNEVFILLMRGYSEELKEEVRGQESKEKLKEILSYIYDNLATVSLAEAANHFGMHPNTLSGFVRKQTGSTFIKLVHQIRLREAAYYMKIPGMKINDVSRAVGYNNLSFFYRLFTEEYGMSPNKYKKQMLAEDSSLYEEEPMAGMPGYHLKP